MRKSRFLCGDRVVEWWCWSATHWGPEQLGGRDAEKWRSDDHIIRVGLRILRLRVALAILGLKRETTAFLGYSSWSSSGSFSLPSRVRCPRKMKTHVVPSCTACPRRVELVLPNQSAANRDRSSHLTSNPTKSGAVNMRHTRNTICNLREPW